MPTLRSFDIFDTIVARRCVHPHNIFRAVEARAGQPGFAEARVQAEATLYRAGEYTLDDIYGLLQTSFGLSAVTAEFLPNRLSFPKNSITLFLFESILSRSVPAICLFAICIYH